MGIVEKIVLTILCYEMIIFFSIIAALGYLMINDVISMLCCLIIVLLFYVLVLIEEQ